jgi:large subunit ribosomal protein L15
MSNVLSKLTAITDKPKKRIGRGIGSGKGGHTSSRGTKGQKSRVGSKIPLWFEGGQLPLVKRLPMIRGKSKFKVVNPTAEVTLTDLNKVTADTVTLDTLKLEKIVDQRFRKAKIIASGKLEKKVTVKGIPATKAAAEAIAQAGGQVVL